MADHAFRGTPFHSSTVTRNSTTWWFSWGGYVVPDVYTDLHTEMQAIRSGVSMNEMSPIPKIQVRGPGAHACVDYFVTRDMTSMQVGCGWYTPWCNEDGKIVADGIVFRVEKDRFIFSGDHSVTFFQEHARAFDVLIEDVTDDHGILALQGPDSLAVLEAATGSTFEDLRFSRVRAAEIAGHQVTIARQGFTGELGFEIWVERSAGTAVWEAVAKAGAGNNIQPAGEYAIDIARVEAGLILISADYTGAGPDQVSADVAPNPTDFVTPFEVGIGHCVSANKTGDFIGRKSIVAERESGPLRQLVGLVFDLAEITQLFLDNGQAPNVSPRVRWDHLPLSHDGNLIGRASSVTWSPSTSQLIGFGLVPTELAEVGTKLTVQWSDHWGLELGPAAVAVCLLPFIDLNRED
jgi:aminomethyltransferase